MQDDLNREKKYITKQKKKKKQNKKANKQKQYDWKNVNRDKFFYHFNSGSFKSTITKRVMPVIWELTDLDVAEAN